MHVRILVSRLLKAGRRKATFCCALVLSAILSGGGCTRGDAVLGQGEVSYYDWFGGYVHPLKSGRRLTQAELQRRREQGSPSYYVARTDGHGRIVRIEKWVSKEMEFAFDYTYSRDGALQEATRTGVDGTRKIQLDEQPTR